jgi:hypothetical protein
MKIFFILSLLLATGWSQDDVRLPPSIKEEPDAEYIYRDSEEIILPCKAFGEPMPTYEWNKNGKILDVNLPNIHRSEDPTDGTITIRPSTVLDEGYYQCVASNQHGKSLSMVAFLQKAVLGSYISAETRPYPVTEGESLIVQCEGIASVPKATFSWALVVDQIDQNPVGLVTSRRIQIDEKGNLYFSHVTMDDAQGVKLYKCNVFNAHLDITTGGSYSDIQVTKNENLNNIAPKILYSTPGPVIALKGESFKIKCIFSGRPEPRVAWGKIGGVLPAGRSKQNHYETELEVTGTMYDDEGEYKCQATGQGTSEVTKIYVDVQARPTFTVHPKNLNASQGETIKFECRAEAEPAVNVLWLINGEPLDQSDPGKRKEISSDGYTLTISDLCKDCPDGTSDLMVIQCNASNVHGYVFADGYLNVLMKTEITKSPETVRLEGDLEELDEVRFECEAKSDDSTPVYYTWYRDNKKLNFDEEKDISLDGSTVVVNLRDKTLDEKAEYDGTYKCVASNTYSQASASANLEVPGGVKPVTGASLGDLWWLFLIIAIILLLLILLLCCCLCIQRNKGDTYPVDEKERANGNDPEKELVDSGFHDYQRPEEGPIKGSRASLSSTIKLDSDDEGSLNEYGDIDAGKFTEDGSFIGQYATDKRRRPNDSQV